MKKRKILIFFGIILLILIIVIIRNLITHYKEKTSVNDFSSVKELIEFDGHEYIAMKDSEEDGYEKDIYLHFSKPTINEDGTTNEKLYEIVISHVAGMLKGHNFRMIDQEKNILVNIQFNDQGDVSLYTINNDGKYWEHIKTNYQIDNYKEETLTTLTVTSPILTNIINSNWIYNQVNLGTKESTVDNYEIYFDEGYKVRKIGSEIYNIIFTQNYSGQVVKDITTITTIENVENLLGSPTFKDDINEIIGYKSKYFYIFFTGDEISIYPTYELDESKNKKFGEIVTKLNKTGDMNTFLNELTDLFPGYASYYSDNNYINIVYPLEGFEVTMGAKKNNGITIYNNFQGYITDSITIDDLKRNKELPANVYTELDTNLIFKEEIGRTTQDYFNRNPYDNAYISQTDNYTVRKNNNVYSFFSRDKSKVDSSLIISNLTKIFSYDQNIFIYGVKKDGIYTYNAEQMSINKIVSGQGNFDIEKIENNTIYYDGTKINI